MDTKTPAFRPLKAYAFDPSLSLKIDTAIINNITYKVTWEKDLKPGPVGEYIEVIDYDPTLEKFYLPVDLNDRHLLAQGGLEPSESNPMFHQQMIYAVIMTTIKNFEKAMGRPVMWAVRRWYPENNNKKRNKKVDYEFIQRLRIYPHAFRDANAYYSPQKKAILFGYFLSRPPDATIQMPGSQVFTCLSHDIIAHETTHAILDGIYNKYIEDTNPDILAFHEAFADIVALFQHFTFPDVLKHQIAKTRGDLGSQNLLGQLAQEFGSAIGGYGALRDAIGSTDPETGEWKPKIPDGNEYQTVTEPHARGSILVSAVFDAFITIYKSRIADLLRIASGGTGILPHGELHPDLVNRLAAEASKSAGHILNMCIRALDYCPPVDLTFGDYLRAIITADSDLVADDSRDYRIAFIDAFRKRGIYPEGIKSLSVESLNYTEHDLKNNVYIQILTGFLRDFRAEVIYANKRKEIFDITKKYIAGDYSGNDKVYGLHRRIYDKFTNSVEFEKLTGLVISKGWERLGLRTSDTYNVKRPSFSINSLKLAERVGPTGKKINQIILTLVQYAGIEIDKDKNIKPYVTKHDNKMNASKFEMSGGVTLIFDLDTLNLKYAVSKPLLDIEALNSKKPVHKLNEQRALKLHEYFSRYYSTGTGFNAYFSPGILNPGIEPFSFLHSH